MVLDRNKRAKQVIKQILLIISAAIFTLLCICIVLAVLLFNTRQKLREAESVIESQAQLLEGAGYDEIEQESVGDFEFSNIPVSEMDNPFELVNPFDQESLLSQEEGDITDPYYIYLTFDDGPSSNTEEILNILREYDVKATFFVTGKTDEESAQLYERIVQGGHTLGMHSYSHKYNEIYSSRESFETDLNKIKNLIVEETGILPIYYRFPGGSSNTATSRQAMKEYIDILHSQGIEYIDWNVQCGDADGSNPSPEKIINNIFKGFGKYHTNVVLLHDGAGHGNTVEALPGIIQRARNMGAKLEPITEATLPVQHLNR